MKSEVIGVLHRYPTFSLDSEKNGVGAIACTGDMYSVLGEDMDSSAGSANDDRGFTLVKEHIFSF